MSDSSVSPRSVGKNPRAQLEPEQKPDITAEIEIIINQQPFLALIDSGCHTVVVAEEFIQHNQYLSKITTSCIYTLIIKVE